MELEGNLWPLSLSLLFASVAILLPPPLKGILSSAVPSILPSFSLVDGNVCFAVHGTAVQVFFLFCFVDSGQICGQAGTGGYEDVGRLGEKLGFLGL